MYLLYLYRVGGGFLFFPGLIALVNLRSTRRLPMKRRNITLLNRVLTGLTGVLLLSSASLSQTTESFEIGNATREYILYVPDGVSESPPLVICMHGLGSNAEQQSTISGFNDIADQEGFIAIYPQGLENESGEASWDISGDTDVEFISALIDTIDNEYGVDPERVYASGMSMGGYMSYKLACSLTNRIAAIGSVAGVSLTYNCSPSEPIPVLQIHGMQDDVVSYDNVSSTIEFWVEHNNCPETPEVTDPYPEGDSESTYYKEHYGPGDENTEVILITGREDGHTWPGMSFFGSESGSVVASEEIWDFFSRHTLSGETETEYRSPVLPISGSVKMIHDSKSKSLRIKSSYAIKSVTLFDLTGTAIASADMNKTSSGIRSTDISTAGLSNGIYIAGIETENKELCKKFIVR